MVKYKVGRTLAGITRGGIGKTFLSELKAIEYAKRHEIKVYRLLKNDERGWHLWWKPVK